MTRLTRRDFLKVSVTAAGALVITSYVDACAALDLTPTVTRSPIPKHAFEANLFIKIDSDGIITLTIHRSEMGQGVRTSLAMILAEELEGDWAKVRVEQSSANTAIGSQTTGGSGSVADHYSILREAGATAREMLVAAAAQIWGVPAEECQAENSNVIHAATQRHMGYGELTAAAAGIRLGGAPKLKDAKDFRIIGTSVQRIDDPDIVTGKAMYGSDIRLPGMLFAVVARCLVPGGKLISYDASKAKSVPGVRDVLQVSSGIAVLAENTWAAIQGRATLTLNWDEGSNAQYSSESIRQALIQAVTAAAAAEPAQLLTTIDAIYETPYLAHAAMAPVSCIADVRADACDIWAGTQNPQAVQTFVQRVVKVPTRVHVSLLGGGFGRMLEVDYAMEAAEVSKAAGAPVQVQWTRDDDLQHDFYRQPTQHWMRAGWDAKGNLSFWRHYIAGPGLNGIAYRAGQEVLEEGLVTPYQIADRGVRSLLTKIALPTGPWRAVMSGPNAFANECFFDEVAAKLNKDPYQFRMDLLDEGNMLRSVLQLAAEKSNWHDPLASGMGRGIACHTYHSTSVAMVAEVTIENGLVRVQKVVCAINCGRVIHPDMVAQQMEGSIVFGLTSLLKNEITIEHGRVQQSNFVDYPILQMNEMPKVEVYIVPDDRDPTGTGEMGVPPIVPAVVNAIFALSGKRIRRTPIKPEDFA